MNYLCAVSHLCVIMDCLQRMDVNFLRGVSSSGVVGVFAAMDRTFKLICIVGFPAYVVLHVHRRIVLSNLSVLLDSPVYDVVLHVHRRIVLSNLFILLDSPVYVMLHVLRWIVLSRFFVLLDSPVYVMLHVH